MRTKYYLFALSLSIISLVSCNEKTDPITPSEDQDFLSTGSYWITEQYDYDSTGNKIEDSYLRDSLTIGNSLLHKNKSCYPVMSSSDTTMYLYFNNKKLYASIENLLPTDGGLDLPIGGGTGGLNPFKNLDWILLADFTSDENQSWNVFEYDTTIGFDLQGTNISVPIDLEMKIVNIGNKDDKVNNETIPVTVFKLIFQMKMSAMGGINIEVTNNFIFDISYNKGIILIENTGQKMNMTGLMGDRKTQGPGYITKTIKYGIVKK